MDGPVLSVVPREYPYLGSSFFFPSIYLKKRGREGEREGEKRQCVVASHVPSYYGPGLQPRHVP